MPKTVSGRSLTTTRHRPLLEVIKIYSKIIRPSEKIMRASRPSTGTHQCENNKENQHYNGPEAQCWRVKKDMQEKEFLNTPSQRN